MPKGLIKVVATIFLEMEEKKLEKVRMLKSRLVAEEFVLGRLRKLSRRGSWWSCCRVCNCEGSVLACLRGFGLL